MYLLGRQALKQRCELSSSEQELSMSNGHEVEHTGEPMLKLSKVTKNFGGLAPFQDVDLEVYPQELISIIGSNGAGKTMVFNLITGIYRTGTCGLTLSA